MSRLLHGALFDLAFLVLTAAWWLPTMLAVWRRHPRVPLIATLNFFLMWPVALIYVVAEPSHRKDDRPAVAAELPADPKVTQFRTRGRWH